MGNKSHMACCSGKGEPGQVGSIMRRMRDTGKLPPSLTACEVELLEAYRRLNDSGKQEIRNALWMTLRDDFFTKKL